MKMLSQARRYYSSILLTLVATSLWSGCKSYQLGGPELPFETIFIKPATNDSFAPQAQVLISTQIRDVFIRDGRVKLVTSKEEADALLLVNLENYERSAASRDQNDTVVARDFDLYLHVEISLYNQNKGDFYFEKRRITGRANAYTDNPYSQVGSVRNQGLLQSEYQAVPGMTRDLARKIAAEVLSPWEIIN